MEFDVRPTVTSTIGLGDFAGLVEAIRFLIDREDPSALRTPAMLTRLVLPRIRQQPTRLVLQPQRLYSATELSNGITLAYDLHEPPSKANDAAQTPRKNAPPILFLHGLFGSKKNNRSMSKYALIDNRETLGVTCVDA